MRPLRNCNNCMTTSNKIWDLHPFHTAPLISSADLPDAIARRVQRVAAEELSPWCKLGQVVFRASAILETRDQIVVTAKVRSREVGHVLDQMVGERWNSFDGQFTWHGRSQYVRVAEIEVTTTASTARTYRISLERKEGQPDSLLEMSFANKSPDDLTEIAIRVALLGERSPLDDQHMDFMVDLPDPFAPLRRQRISDEILRPIAQLFLVEALVGSGRIARITSFRLGTQVAGKRRPDDRTWLGNTAPILECKTRAAADQRKHHAAIIANWTCSGPLVSDRTEMRNGSMRAIVLHRGQAHLGRLDRLPPCLDTQSLFTAEGALMPDKKAVTDYPIHELLAKRWSPYAFADRPISKTDLLSLFEAARWAPSSYNEQPWSYIVATKEDSTQFTQILSCLVEGNQTWAKAAPVLALGIVSLKFCAQCQRQSRCRP